MNTLPRPIGRMTFLGRVIIGAIAWVAIYMAFVWAVWFATGRGKENVPVVFLFFGLWVVAILLVAMCFVRFVIIARLAAIGANRWFALLLLVPYLNFFFVLFLLVYPMHDSKGT